MAAQRLTMDLEKVEKLIGLMKQYELGELRVSDKDWEFSARRGERPQPQQPFMMSAPIQHTVASVAASAAEPAIPVAANIKEITAPIVGTFYRQPAPGQAAFKEVGDHVNPDDVVCIVEAMKVMNEIKAGVTGKIRKIFHENATPVEYGQVLFLVEAG